MAGISTTLTLHDKFSNTINKGINGVNRMLKTMRELDVQTIKMAPAKVFTAATTAIDKTIKELKEFNQKQQEAAKKTKGIVDGWTDIKDAIVGAATAYGAMEVINLSDRLTSTTARIGLMIDTEKGEDVEGVSAKIMEAAQRSRSAYLDMADAVAKLGLNAGAAFDSTDETIAFMEQVNKMFVIGGASAQEQSDAMTQLTQAMASGVLRGDELNTILDAGPQIAREIEKYMGIAEGKIKTVAEEGKITADVVKNALFAAAGRTDAAFDDMPQTFAQAATRIKNYALMTFDDVLKSINQFLNSGTGQAMINFIMGMINVIAVGVQTIFSIIGSIGDFIQQNWTFIMPLLVALASIVGVVLVNAFWGWARAAAVAGIKSLVAMLPLIKIGLVIAAAIGIIVIACNLMGVTFDQVAGFIGGVLYSLYAVFYNIIAYIWERWRGFVEFFANVFNEPVYSVKKLFVSLANDILDTVKKIAGAIDAVFGSNLSGAVSGLQSDMSDWLGEMPDSYKVTKSMEMKSIGEYWNKGKEAGEGFSNKLADKFGDISSKLNGDEFNYQSMLGTNSQYMPNIDKVGEVGKIKQDVNIAEEDLQLMKDVAEMRYVQNFVTLTPTVAMQASISEKVDVNNVIGEIERRLEEEFAAAAEGHYM